jgi:hemerythrin superfamily protein
LPEKDAIAILKKDHDTVKGLFEQFDKAETPAAKKKIMAQALTELKIHAVLEEEIFYPTVRRKVGDKLMSEADEEHHVAKVLIAELDQLSDRNDHRDAKFTVLAESVRHHIKEEEDQMLPKAKELDIDFEQLGARMLDRKKQLLRDGIPSDAEHAMVAAAGGHADSPAAAAARHKRVGARPKATTTRNGKTSRRKNH